MTKPAASFRSSVVIAAPFPAVSLAATAWRAVLVGAPDTLVAKVRGRCTLVEVAARLLAEVEGWVGADELPPLSALLGLSSPAGGWGEPGLLSSALPGCLSPAGGWGPFALPPSLALPGLLPPFRVPSGLPLFTPPAPPVA